MGQFRDKFGLDYLREAESAAKQESAGDSSKKAREELPPGMEDALVAYGRPVIEVLKTSPDRTARVFDLLERLDLRIDTLIPVVNFLISKGLVTRIEEDKRGNDVLRVTERGQKLFT